MKVTKDNAVVGLKVVLDKDSQFAGQGKDAEYGVIVDDETHFPATPNYLWVQVNWIRADGTSISTDYYRIGDDGEFDLNVYEVIPEYVECIKTNTDCFIAGKIYKVNSNGTLTTEQEYECMDIFEVGKDYYGVYGFKISDKASFDAQQNPKETLVGRYLKALVNNPVSISMDIGEYLLITKYNHQGNTYNVTRVRDNHTGFGIEVSDLPKFEVMPIGFNLTEVKEEPIEEGWCIKITSENQDLVKKWFLEKGYESGHCYSIGAYYGELHKKGRSDSFSSFAKELTLDEFKRLVLKENITSIDLLEEAKQRYPIGTKFYPAHLSQRKQHCIVTSTNFKISDTCVYQVTDSGSLYDNSRNSKYGNTTYNRCVYENGKWAEIIEEPKTNTTEEFKVGDWVVPLNDDAYHDRNIGEAYQIETLDGSTAVRMFNRELKYDGNGWIEIKDLRKATPEEIAKVQGYKVTDTYFKYRQQPYSEFIKNPEEYPIFVEPKKQKYQFSEVEYLAKPINQQLDLPIVKKYKKKSIINL